ncbi:MAG: branched-chain amino acid ABC transporter permease [Acidobacteria bacterium]|nr:branched-chain amino acid ABC transporter permease [Acidobacteriota bacterium]MCA1611717.1 branched-chain amino acid ABC transporter permease [Acidobacteriota bacterium]
MNRRRVVTWALLALGLAALVLLPRFVTSYKLLTYTRLLLLALMAQGWNFIGGYTGYASFGNVAYFGIGAYTTGLLMIGKWHVPFFPSLFAGAALCAILAALLGLPILRLKGHYFAIATLGVAEASRQIADTWDSVTAGSTGIDLPLKTEGEFFYYTALALVVGGIAVTALLVRSKVGYAWVAIREDQDAARMLGIATTRYKTLAYSLSAAFSALAGGVTAYQNIHVTPTDFFKLDYTLQSIIAVVIGGTGTVLGPLIGAGIYQLLSTYVWTKFIELHPTVLGILIIFFVVFLPRGLVPLFRATRRTVQTGRGFHWRDLFANIRAHRVT